jgi:hypothetical protein
MKLPTEAEFRDARVLAERDDDFSELAYQVCRWYRGQMFIRDNAEKALLAMRNGTVPSLVEG